MKHVRMVAFIASIGLNIVVLGYVIARRGGQVNKWPPTIMQQFAITNVNASVNGEDYIIVYKNGVYWWEIGKDKLSMNVGLNGGATLYLAKSTGKIRKIILELLDTNGARSFYVDANADGIPDKKEGPNGEQIFYNGKFVPLFSENGKRYIILDGVHTYVEFNGTRWIVTQQ